MDVPDGQTSLPPGDPQIGLLLVALSLETGWGHHRRVEKRDFLDESTLRLRLSFDVTIPDSAPRIGPDNIRLVPLTFLKKRDLTDLDFTDDTGRSIPMLTSSQSGQFAADGLMAFAEPLRPKIGRRKPALHDDVRADLTTIASADLPASLAVLAQLDQLLNRGLPAQPTVADQQRYALWSDEAFPEITRRFANSYLVCATTNSQIGERRIFHLSFLRDYELKKTPREKYTWIPRREDLLATLGARPRVFEVPLDDQVSANSYHAEVQTPGDVHVVALDVVEVVAPQVLQPAPAGLREETTVLRHEAGSTNKLHVRVPPTQALSERRISCQLQVRQRGWLRNSALLAAAATGLLLASGVWLDRLARPTVKPENAVTTCTGRIATIPTAAPSPTPTKPGVQPTPALAVPELPASVDAKCTRVDKPGPNDQTGLAATVLLALLGVAATVLTRPGDNPLASKLLAGARFLTVSVAITVFLASGSLAVLRQGPGLEVTWWVFTGVTGACAIWLNRIAWWSR